MNEGHLTLHLRRMRRLYGARRQYFIAACEEHLGEWLQLRATESGIQLVGVFHSAHDDRIVAARARLQGINVSPLSIQYQHAGGERGLVMGFAASDEKTTRTGMRKLKAILKEASA